MNNAQPLFKSVFGQQWETLPTVIRKRYANHAYSNDVVTMKGKMNIGYSRMMVILLPLFRLFGVLVPYKENGVPVTVNFRSQLKTSIINFDRIFYFHGRKPYCFSSRIEQVKENDLIEFMRFGLGWRSRCIYDGNKVLFKHSGYVGKFFGYYIPLPFGIFLGKAYAEEQAISNNTFRMLMNITHPWFGKMFEYTGEFTIID